MDGFITFVYIDDEGRSRPHGITIEAETEEEIEIQKRASMLLKLKIRRRIKSFLTRRKALYLFKETRDAQADQAKSGEDRKDEIDRLDGGEKLD